jgi:2-succinyl-5-enolpyruvyl-6-hydroxy-3-cyclohexene-1-carboxylate synthase
LSLEKKLKNPISGSEFILYLILRKVTNYSAINEIFCNFVGDMQTTDKVICRELIDLLVNHGIKDVILSPGTRNAPLIMAVTRNEKLRSRVVIDERCAAFVALGMASQLQSPVALVCTSGTAMLNYAPAIAEAFYREVPLIVITADRPAEWIDQDDCQTIHQFEAYGKLVKQSINVSDALSESALWMANRKINDAIISATSGRKGPVHINVQLDTPLTATVDVTDEQFRIVQSIFPEPAVSTSLARILAAELKAPAKILIAVGFNPPSQKLNKALKKISQLSNVVVIAEAQSNIYFNECIHNIDAIFSVTPSERIDDLKPDYVITLGGSLLSQPLKKWLRSLQNVQQWHVGEKGLSVDCFTHLSKRIEVPAYTFMAQLASGLMPFKTMASNYANMWHKASSNASILHAQFVKDLNWCDLLAVTNIVSMLPDKCNLQLSNGTVVRYAQLANYSHLHRIDCNRGVSGIDGSTSTAIGAAIAYDGTTVLITGDMSAQYDLGALAIHDIPKQFKMIVIDNDGGNIFRYIKPTSKLPECNDYFAAHVHLPMQHLAEGFGFDFYEASDMLSLKTSLARLLATSSKPSVLVVHTSGEFSASILKKYLTQHTEFKK